MSPLWPLSGNAFRRFNTCWLRSRKISVRNLVNWLTLPPVKSKRPSSLPIQESDFRRTAALAARTSDCASGTIYWPKANSFVNQERATLIGLTCLTTNGKPLIAPKLNRRRAVFVLSKIDEILSWERATDRERDSKFVELGRYLCEVRAGQYWRVDNVRSFDEFLERKFPESRRKAYYLMAIHEQLPRIHKIDLQQVGWTKATELAKVARRDGQRFDSATWLHKARELPKEEFKREVSKHLTGKETEPWEILYFKAYKSQLPVIEQALETAALMLGSDKSRGYCLEMICADFLAGVSLEAGNREALLPCLTRLVIALPKPQRRQLLEEVQVTL